MKNYILRSFNYTAWANQKTLASLQACPAAHEEGAPIIAHMIAAENVWLSRLTSSQPAFAVWPTLTIDECQTLVAESEKTWSEFLSTVTDDKLLTAIDYQNTRGEPFCDSVMDILTHVTLHGAYHRGQIAKIVRQKGGTPAATDFIVYVRNQAAKTSP